MHVLLFAIWTAAITSAVPESVSTPLFVAPMSRLLHAIQTRYIRSQVYVWGMDRTAQKAATILDTM